MYRVVRPTCAEPEARERFGCDADRMVMALLGVFAGLLVLYVLVSSGAASGGTLVLALVCLMLVILCLQSFQTIEVEPDGIKFSCALGQRKLRWDEVQSVNLRTLGLSILAIKPYRGMPWWIFWQSKNFSQRMRGLIDRHAPPEIDKSGRPVRLTKFSLGGLVQFVVLALLFYFFEYVALIGAAGLFTFWFRSIQLAPYLGGDYIHNVPKLKTIDTHTITRIELFYSSKLETVQVHTNCGDWEFTTTETNNFRQFRDTLVARSPNAVIDDLRLTPL